LKLLTYHTPFYH